MPSRNHRSSENELLSRGMKTMATTTPPDADLAQAEIALDRLAERVCSRDEHKVLEAVRAARKIKIRANAILEQGVGKFPASSRNGDGGAAP